MSDEGDDIGSESGLEVRFDRRADGGEVGRETLDRLLTTLSSHRRRYILYYLRERETADLDELTRYLAEERIDATIAPVSDKHVEETKTRLIHSVLPKLREAGIVEYDPRSGTVRYRRPSKVLRILLRVCSELENPPTRSE